MKRAASCFQLKTSDRGTTTSDGLTAWPAARSSRRVSSSASTCAVLPTPMSSARQPPKREAAQELHPAQALALVIAQAGPRSRRAARRHRRPETAQLLAHAGEGLVAAGLGLGGQQGIEQSGLAPAEADVIVLAAFPGRPAGRCGAATPPAAGRRCRRPADHVLAAAQGFQQRGQFRRGVAVVHLAVQLEPVDAGGNLQPEPIRTPENLALGLDMPARLHQRPDDARQLAGG